MRFRELPNPSGTGTILVSEARLADPAVAAYYGMAPAPENDTQGEATDPAGPDTDGDGDTPAGDQGDRQAPAPEQPQAQRGRRNGTKGA